MPKRPSGRLPGGCNPGTEDGKHMKTKIIDDYDSTCFDASLSAGHLNNNESSVEYAAIPDTYTKEVVRTTAIAQKRGENYICLKFADGKEARIRSFTGSSPENAMAEAIAALKEAETSENDVDWWEDIDD